MSHTEWLHTEKLNQLKKRISGSVLTEGDKAYDKQRTPWLQVVDQHPAAIVNAANTQDITETIRFARDVELPLAVQNTGHGIALPCNGGILLRLSEMKAISVDISARTAIIEPGVQSGELLAATEPHGLGFPSGQVSNVGVIGYTLGGGVGWLGRKEGAACHAFESATVVLADGSVVTASSTENPDLLWALRGGGGNFGVIASMTLKLVKLGKVFGGMVYYRMKDAPEVLRFYRDWTANLSNNTSTVLRLMKLPPKPAYLLHLLNESCAIGVCHADEATAGRLHDELKQFKSATLDQLEVLSYSSMAEFDQASEESGSPTYGHLECLKELSDTVIDGLIEVANTRIPPLMIIELQQLGGALSAERADAMAYTAPQSPFILHMVSPAMKASLDDLALVTKGAYNSLGPVFTGEVSYNFLRGDQQDRVPAAFGEEKFARLQSLKRQYDPSNLFHFNLNIPPGEA